MELPGKNSAMVCLRTALAGLVFALFLPVPASAGPLDEMSLERWKLLRETERYQLDIAEKYYRERNWKVALAEYEKFLTLHERSEGAPYAQLKWSLCQTHLRKLNTAIKEGLQTVIDYWPDSPEAIAAAYFIGSTYKDMAELKSAKKAFANVVAGHPTHLVAVLAKSELADIARIENDTPRRVALWKELTFDTDRKGGALTYCQNASVGLATHYFYEGNCPEGLRALATTYSPEQMPYHTMYYAQGGISQLTGDPKTKAQGEKVADLAIESIREKIPVDLKDDATKAQARNFEFYIADLHMAARRPEKAREVYDQMLAKHGSEDDILGRLAQWFKTQNKRDEARQTYARYKNQIEGQSQVAYSFREERRYEDAANVYRELAIKDTKDANRWQGELGHALRDAGKHKEAIAAYRLWDSFPATYWYMASCHRSLGEFKEALALYHQAAAEPSWTPQSMLQIGYTYEQSKESEKAIKSFQLVCKKFPKTGEASQAHAHLQNAYKITATLGGAKDE